MRRTALATALMASAVITAVPAVAGASPLPAEKGAAARFSPCWKRWDAWWCDNRWPAPVLVNGQVVDNLRKTPKIFRCRAELDWHGLGPHPRRWVYTRGDDHGAWGWVKDSDINGDTDPLPTC
ncbi:hypothetical protein [Actinomadura citrea]|uniref:Secreted protein n=1 Tax=Actinomadura citrea TaxID=46158 RepID=A0A7Y9GJC2_9ACTN|nr:hypothetical protein [Actinomadura citrea]NYE16430.1 hypothetical protein [Actinomadura citrea]GGT95044.1 hypothetical protein GCM10010177_62590 [Actinomadura citrea]